MVELSISQVVAIAAAWGALGGALAVLFALLMMAERRAAQAERTAGRYEANAEEFAWMIVSAPDESYDSYEIGEHGHRGCDTRH